MSQIPAGAEGTVAGVMLYCFTCLIASSVLIWLTWTHCERTSYPAMLSYFAMLSIIASIVQQIFDITRYSSLVKEQFEHRKLHPHNPEVAITNGSVGFSLVLYYVQYYCYGVEAMSFMFWAASLTQSVYGLSARSRHKPILRRINRSGKVIAILLPLICVLLLRIPQFQENFVPFILLADLPLMLSLFFGCIFVIAIVCRYVHTKRKFLHWSEDASSEGYNNSTLEIEPSANGGPNLGPRRRRQGLIDRWLMVRFTIAFVGLSTFEVTNTLFQLRSVLNAEVDFEGIEPDYSAERAKISWIFFMPGATPGLFMFIVFGTTAPFRKQMYETFVPKRWQNKAEDKTGSKIAAPVILVGQVPGRPLKPLLKDRPAAVEIEPVAYRKARGSDSDSILLLPIRGYEERYTR